MKTQETQKTEGEVEEVENTDAVGEGFDNILGNQDAIRSPIELPTFDFSPMNTDFAFSSECTI